MKSNINKRNRVRNVVAYGIVSNLNQPHCTSLKLPGSPGHQFWRCTLWSSAPGFWISIPTVNQWWTSNYSPQLVVGYSLTLILYEYSVFYRKSGFIFLNQFTYKCLLQNLVGFCMFWRPRIIGGFTFFPPPTMCTDRTSPMKTGRCERANLIAKITVAMATTCPTPAEHMELRIFESKTRSWSNALITFKHVSSKTKLWWVFGAKAKKSITNQFPAPTSTSAPRAAVHIEQRFDRSWGSPVPSVRGLMLLGATSTCMALGIGLWLRTCEKMTYPTCTSSLTQKAILLAHIIIFRFITDSIPQQAFCWSPMTRLRKSSKLTEMSTVKHPNCFYKTFVVQGFLQTAPTFRQPARRSFPASCIPCNLVGWLML